MNKSTPQQLPPEFSTVKLCECGCGQPAPIAKRSNKKLGHIKGRPWIAAYDQHGYGQLNTGDGHRVKAHRVAYEPAYGAIPLGLSVCHRCDNPACVNPAHLFVGSHQDNMQDMRDKGRGSDPPPNQVRGETNGRATFTDAEVVALRQEFAQMRMSIQAFAEAHGVPKIMMWRILRRKNYTHV